MSDQKITFETDLQEAIVKGNAAKAIVSAKMLHRELTQTEIVELGVHALFSNKSETFRQFVANRTLSYPAQAKENIFQRVIATGDEKGLKNYFLVFENRQPNADEMRILTSSPVRNEAIAKLNLKKGVVHPQIANENTPSISELGEIITP